MSMTTAAVPRVRAGLLAVAALTVLAIAMILVLSPGAEGSEADPGPGPIEATPLTSGGHNLFADDVAAQVRDRPEGRSTDVINLRDASRLATAEIVIPPGAAFPWHTHPGPVLAAVADGAEEGAFVYVYADDCVERPYEVGEAFIDPGDSVHTAYNPSDEETVVIATFLGVGEGEPLTQPVQDAEEAHALNEACDQQAPVPGQD